MTRRARTRAWWLVALLLLFAVWYAIFIGRTAFRVHGDLHFTLFDDAMISMRYARNLAEGHGLVWNAQGPRVEGFTNPLWTFWMAGLHLLPVPEAKISLLVMTTSALLLLANLVVVKAIADELGIGGPFGAMAVVLTGVAYPLVYWSLRGMEVGLLAILIDIGILLTLRLRTRTHGAPRLLMVTLVAAVTVRMDALIPVAVITVFAWALTRRLAILAWLGGAIAGTVATLTALRLAYYGDALPNTYYLKATGVAISQRIDAGLSGVSHLLPGHGLTATWFLAAALAIVALARRPDRRALPWFLLGAVVAGQVAYSVFVGGDAWENMGYANRYIAVALPCLALLAAGGTERLTAAATGWAATDTDSRRVTRLAVAAITTVVVAVTMNGGALRAWTNDNAELADADAYGARLGMCERAATDPSARIAVFLAGNGPYFSHRTSIDLLGKSDRHIARLPVPRDVTYRPGHNKSDLHYSIAEQRPDLAEVANYSWMGRPSDLGAYAFARWGYDLFDNGLAVRSGTDEVRIRAVRAFRRQEPGRSAAC